MTGGTPALVGSVATYTVVAALLAACVGHLLQPAGLRHALAAHGVLPAQAAVAATVTAVEVLLAGAGAVALVRPDPGRLLVAALVGSAGLFALVGGYGWYVLSTGRRGPCGCSRAGLPMSGWVVARAVALGALALAGLALSDRIVPVGRGGAGPVLALLAAATFACLLWQLPAAMHDPPRAGFPSVPATAVSR